ncbi:hypothetical protein [Paludisphaera sp.]|uniref:hypothetical protein n=1 Tax=Paludisphaera sp. TaxID=2017432 RepID=UPI00301DD06B
MASADDALFAVLTPPQHSPIRAARLLNRLASELTAIEGENALHFDHYQAARFSDHRDRLARAGADVERAFRDGLGLEASIFEIDPGEVSPPPTPPQMLPDVVELMWYWSVLLADYRITLAAAILGAANGYLSRIQAGLSRLEDVDRLVVRCEVG